MTKMIKAISTVIFLTMLVFNGTVANSEDKLDCSQYTNETLMKTLERRRCLKGLPQKEKTSLGTKLKKYNPFKKRN